MSKSPKPQRRTFRYWLQQLHLWVGLILLLPLVLMGITGAVLVYAHDLEHLLGQGEPERARYQQALARADIPVETLDLPTVHGDYVVGMSYLYEARPRLAERTILHASSSSRRRHGRSEKVFLPDSPYRDTLHPLPPPQE